ncbi:DUF3099 domain-containing protein [Arthrobacter sp. 35W]|uniref:DUF3099 domain-containing protein n=1 Tax=Arthrobacter sp. 35W TaxID=1132441 RepID=UPI0006865615|nr:DUF3099 domain-containing protein [Arthrobacter sp. 35W]
MKHNIAPQPTGPAGDAPHDAGSSHAPVADVHNITDARTGHSDEMRSRMIKYATAMGIRMVCLVLIFVFDGWFKLIPVVGAVLLPWIAVVIANGGSDTVQMHSTALLDEAPLAELEGSDDGAAGDDEGPVVLQGEIIDDEEA